ncbi:hypothetical protein FQN55_001350 [Onygenales sp. PD_40]|nr:hypothetical protein FQN55_001350 [Onygenales sp. PD_40]
MPFHATSGFLHEAEMPQKATREAKPHEIQSKTQKAATQPRQDTNATSHHASPTMPISRPSPYHDPANTGPTVRKAEDTDCPIPCTVPSTDGCGEQLFSRIIDVGNVNVRDSTCKNSTTMIEIHTHMPVAWAGGAELEGLSDMNGASA